jgi:hypothetical protein
MGGVTSTRFPWLHLQAKEPAAAVKRKTPALLAKIHLEQTYIPF